MSIVHYYISVLVISSDFLREEKALTKVKLMMLVRVKLNQILIFFMKDHRRYNAIVKCLLESADNEEEKILTR